MARPPSMYNASVNNDYQIYRFEGPWIIKGGYTVDPTRPNGGGGGEGGGNSCGGDCAACCDDNGFGVPNWKFKGYNCLGECAYLENVNKHQKDVDMSCNHLWNRNCVGE